MIFFGKYEEYWVFVMKLLHFYFHDTGFAGFEPDVVPLSPSAPFYLCVCMWVCVLWLQQNIQGRLRAWLWSSTLDVLNRLGFICLFPILSPSTSVCPNCFSHLPLIILYCFLSPCFIFNPTPFCFILLFFLHLTPSAVLYMVLGMWLHGLYSCSHVLWHLPTISCPPDWAVWTIWTFTLSPLDSKYILYSVCTFNVLEQYVATLFNNLFSFTWVKIQGTTCHMMNLVNKFHIW